MKIAAFADTEQGNVLKQKTPEGILLQFCERTEPVPAADLYIDLHYEEQGYFFTMVTDKPVLVNAVTDTTAKLPGNAIRINAWPGFLERNILELATGSDHSFFTNAIKIFEQLGWQCRQVPDVPGLTAPRIIAMIINEAYFALGDGISTKESIDTAMQLGTNYPYGPFAWCEKIGIHKIQNLLSILAGENPRYLPAPALIAESL